MTELETACSSPKSCGCSARADATSARRGESTSFEPAKSTSFEPAKSTSFERAEPRVLPLDSLPPSGDAEGRAFGWSRPRSFAYLISSDGALELISHLHIELRRTDGADETPPTLPRVGVSLELPRALQTARWFGLGPHENYPDRRAGAPPRRRGARLGGVRLCPRGE